MYYISQVELKVITERQGEAASSYVIGSFCFGFATNIVTGYAFATGTVSTDGNILFGASLLAIPAGIFFICQGLNRSKKRDGLLDLIKSETCHEETVQPQK